MAKLPYVVTTMQIEPKVYAIFVKPKYVNINKRYGHAEKQ